MKKSSLLLLMCVLLLSFSGGGNWIGEAYQAMLHYFFTTDLYVKSGNIFPSLEQKKGDDLPLALHIEMRIKNRPDILNFLRRNYNKSITYQKFTDLEQILVQASPATDTSSLVYSSKTRHVMGTLTIMGIYTLSEKGVLKDVYFDVVRRAYLRDKSSFNDLLKFSYINGKWIFRKMENISKS